MQPVILDRALNEMQDVDDSLSKTDNFVQFQLNQKPEWSIGG